MDSIQADMGLIGKDGLELMALHEEVQSLLEQGRLARARNVAEQLLRRRPEFAPALNNISQTYFIEGKTEQAIATAQQVLSFDPDNHHALSNLTRYLCLSGRLDEAREWAGQLKAVQSEAMGVWVKKAEALSYLGDDQGMLDVFAGAGQAGYLKSSLVDPLLYHLAAVATMRLGDEKQARRYWKQALKLPSGLDLARDNLADLRRPVDQRHAPWAFDLSSWVSPQALEDLVAHLERGNRRKSDAAITRASRHYLERHPEITGLVPLLLDRGDPGGREFALRVALMAETPEMLDALRDFALSQRGPDSMRNEAARAASEAGLLPAGPVRLWLQGKWREILLLSFELHDEILAKHSQRVEQWLTEATLALQQGKADRAERLLQQALEIDPEAPDLLNNLAAAYDLQGRVQEAETLVRQIHERFPDYVFARTGLARIHLSRGEIEQSEDLLEPLFSRQRLHFYEFGAFCDVQVQILVAKGELEGARSWLDMWATADPENPTIAGWRRRLGKGRRRRPILDRRA
jgi:Flp pilus assembly protein TadD